MTQNDELQQPVDMSKRPILTHITADNAWLLSFPNPTINEKWPKAYFHLLCDPWLQGPATAGPGRWFHAQWHTVKTTYTSMAEIETHIKSIERKAIGEQTNTVAESHHGLVDAIIISNSHDDHMHKETLVQMNPSTPVLANENVVPKIKAWNHFHNVKLFPNIDSVDALMSKAIDTGEAGQVLPPWLSIWNMPPMGTAAPDFYNGIIFVWSPSGETQAQAPREIVLNCPHGISPESVQFLQDNIQPGSPLSMLCLLHNWTVSTIAGRPSKLGAHNGLNVQRVLNSKYWLRTHDEPLQFTGLTRFILNFNDTSIEAALEKEEKEGRRKNDHRDFIFKDLGVGEAITLY